MRGFMLVCGKATCCVLLCASEPTRSIFCLPNPVPQCQRSPPFPEIGYGLGVRCRDEIAYKALILSKSYLLDVRQGPLVNDLKERVHPIHPLHISYIEDLSPKKLTPKPSTLKL